MMGGSLFRLLRFIKEKSRQVHYFRKVREACSDVISLIIIIIRNFVYINEAWLLAIQLEVYF